MNPTKTSRSIFLDVRGLRYHVRSWGNEGAPKIFMLHGFMDVSASYQFVVDALRGDWQVLAPDWRGFGLTQWAGRDSYWFPDYLADLDALLDQLQPAGQINLLGHSMGGNITCLYAGVRPERMRRVINMDTYGLRVTHAEEAPRRYREWLDELEAGASFRDYASFEDLARRMRENNPRLSPEKAAWLAPHWGRRNDRGRVELACDPVHRFVNPVLYRLEEAMACWANISAPVLTIEAGLTHTRELLGLDAQEIARRQGMFRNMRVARVTDAGHMLHHEQPEQVAALIESFLLEEQPAAVAAGAAA